MAKEFDCPTCDAPLVVNGDEKPGDELFCPTCGSPSVMKAKDEDEELQAEEDY
jgi:uncharacterized Zn finger protein (UPF0148 family)